MSNDKKLLVVFGITGTQGSSVATTFLSEPGWRVRGITRNASSPSAKAWSDKGAEVVQGDLDDTDSLVAAFQGAYAVFAVTDFWMHLKDQSNWSKAEEAGIKINKYAFNEEVRQGMNVAVAASHESVAKTLQRFVYSSLSDTRKWSKGKYLNNYHFDSKAKVVDQIRAQLPALAEKMSCVQIGSYMTNWKGGYARPKKQSDGTFLVPLLDAVSASPVLPFVATDKDTGVFVRALLLSSPPGTQVLGVSEYGTLVDFWETWARVTGNKVAFEQVDGETYFKGLPQALVQEVWDSYRYNRDFEWTGGDSEVVDVWKIDPSAKTTSLADYIKEEDWSLITDEKA